MLLALESFGSFFGAAGRLETFAPPRFSCRGECLCVGRSKTRDARSDDAGDASKPSSVECPASSLIAAAVDGPTRAARPRASRMKTCAAGVTRVRDREPPIVPGITPPPI